MLNAIIGMLLSYLFKSYYSHNIYAFQLRFQENPNYLLGMPLV